MPQQSGESFTELAAFIYKHKKAVARHTYHRLYETSSNHYTNGSLTTSALSSLPRTQMQIWLPALENSGLT